MKAQEFLRKEICKICSDKDICKDKYSCKTISATEIVIKPNKFFDLLKVWRKMFALWRNR